MYYMSVNPVNSAMIKAYGGTYRTEAQVAAFNKSIRMSLCSGSNNYFTYIDARHFRSMDGSVTFRIKEYMMVCIILIKPISEFMIIV